MPETLAPPLQKQRDFAGKSNEEIADWLEQRWKVVDRQFDVLQESVRDGSIEPDDVYPTVHHTIAVMASSLFGYSIQSPRLIDAELLRLVNDGHQTR